jgi:hypothetical protein
MLGSGGWQRRRRIGKKWVHDSRACARKVTRIPRDDGQIVLKRNRCNLFVDQILIVSTYEKTPSQGAGLIETQYSTLECFENRIQPSLNQPGVAHVTPAFELLRAGPQFSYNLDRKKQFVLS